MRRWIKRGLLACLAAMLVVGLGGFAYVYTLDLDAQPPADPDSTVGDLAFMRDADASTVGRIAVWALCATPSVPGTGV